MTILIAPDKFKGSLSAVEVCEAISVGIHRFNTNVNIVTNPLADGGEGSLDILGQYLNMQEISVKVNDPLMRPIDAVYKIHNKRAYIEMSAASGLVLLAETERNCMNTTTFGTGEMIRDALRRGIRDIVLFIGGSATNDAGTGMAKALGYDFFDAHENPVIPIGKNLSIIQFINKNNLLFNLKNINVQVLCDVTNPLYGLNGAAHTYARQKGANDSEIEHLDKGLRNISEVLKAHDYPDVAKLPGAGAAGGMGVGAVAFLGAKMVSGIEFFTELTNLESKIQTADLVITGEGKFDEQTLQGKVINGITNMAKAHDVPVIVICGASEMDGAKMGIQKVYSVMDISSSVEEAMRDAKQKVSDLAFQMMREL